MFNEIRYQPEPDTYLNPQQNPTDSTTSPLFGSAPTQMRCPHCNGQITTLVRSQRALSAYVTCILCFFGGCWPCCCIPCFMDLFKKHKHTCPYCNTYLGSYKPLYF